MIILVCKHAIIAIENFTYQTSSQLMEEIPLASMALDLDRPLEAVIVPDLMTAPQARECIEQIKGHLRSVRLLLLELDERRGWSALGYQSLRQCLVAEFGRSQSQLYRELKAGKIERVISPRGEIGKVAEKHLRHLGKLPQQQWSAAWDEAVATAPAKGLTAIHIAQTVAKIQRQSPVARDGEVQSDCPLGAARSDRPTGGASDRQLDDVVLINCRRTAEIDGRVHYGCWGTVVSIGELGGIQVAVRGQLVRFMKSDLESVDRPSPILLEVAQKVNQLFERDDLDELDRQILEFFVRRLTFTSKQLERLEYLWNVYM